MMVVGDNVVCVGLYGTVNKLVVVRVSIDKIKTIIWCEEHDILALYNSVENKISRSFTSQSAQYFSIFFQNLIGYTKRVPAIKYRHPNIMVCAFRRNALYETVCVEYNTHDGLYSKIVLLFLFAKPLMKIHTVYFIKSLLVKDALVPKVVKMCIKFLGIVIAHELFDVIQLLIALDAREHVKKVKLCGIENSWLYAFHNFLNY